jgi:hypothetical protein
VSSHDQKIYPSPFHIRFRSRERPPHRLSACVIPKHIIIFGQCLGLAKQLRGTPRASLKSRRSRVSLNCAEGVLSRLESGLYGTFARRWTKSTVGGFGQYAGEYEGDGVTKTFQLVMSGNLNLQYWE